MRGARAERRDQVLFKGAGLWERYEGKSELLPLPSTLPSFPSLFRDRDLGSLPPLCPAGMKAGAGCWDGRLSRGGGGGGEEGEGGRGGGSDNYTQQLWGLLKSRMKQRAAAASAAVGAEEPKHHGRAGAGCYPCWERPGAPRGSCSLVSHRRQPLALPPSPLESPGEGAGLEGSKVSPAMVTGSLCASTGKR